MGATSWEYFVPFTPSPADALKRLRNEVFKSGRYRKPRSRRDYLDDAIKNFAEYQRLGIFGQKMTLELLVSSKRIQDAIDSDSDEGLSDSEKKEYRLILRANELSERYPISLNSILRRGQELRKRARSIQALVELAEDSGTHSIIDIQRISGRPEFAAASPVPVQDLLKAFGTDRPTREQVDASNLPFSEVLLPWHAVFFTIYRDRKPVEYMFIGCSGD